MSHRNAGGRMALRPFARFFADPVYRANYIVVCSTRDRFVSRVTKVLATLTLSRREQDAMLLSLTTGHVFPDCLDVLNGVAFRLSPQGLPRLAVIWINPGADVGVLVHEAWHAAFYVLSNRGVSFDAGSDGLEPAEPVAYYLEFIVQKALGLR